MYTRDSTIIYKLHLGVKFFAGPALRSASAARLILPFVESAFFQATSKADGNRVREFDQQYREAVDTDTGISDEMENAMRAAGLNI